jgi:hypothetical protein
MSEKLSLDKRQRLITISSGGIIEHPNRSTIAKVSISQKQASKRNICSNICVGFEGRAVGKRLKVTSNE